MTRRVALLHGIWNARAWLAPLARRLRAEGLLPTVIGYDSVLRDPAANLPMIVAQLRALGEVAIVGHSLGGIMALEALRAAPDLRVHRVVCLGSPLRGSRTAQRLAAAAWGAPVLGRSAAILQRDLARWEGRVEVGVVAGNIPHGLGRLLCRFDGDCDGTVAVEETRLPGLADHCVVKASHSGLVLSRAAAAQAARFIRDGRFLHPGAAGA